MKKIVSFVMLFWFFAGPILRADPCPAYTNTGFCWPTGTSDFTIGANHLEHGSDRNIPGNNYISGYYHLGVDMMAAQGSYVWPIAKGKIVRPPSYGGWTAGDTSNYALLIEKWKLIFFILKVFKRVFIVVGKERNEAGNSDIQSKL